MKQALGATAAPAHPRSVEAYADEVAHGALSGAGADVEILPAQVSIAHAAPVFDQVLEDSVEALALALVVRTCLWDRGVGIAQGFDDGKDSPLAQPGGLLADPSTQLFGALGVDALARGPELLDDVVPVQTHLRVGEVDLLKTPDMLRAISKEHCLLLAVATLERLAVQPHEERFVALEGRDEPLVDGSLDAIGSAAQGVDDADDGQFGVLALVAFCASLARMLTSAKAASVAPRTVESLVWASSSLVLGLSDHRRAAPVDLHHEDLTVVVGRGNLFEERARMIANRVDHTQSGARARSPLVRLAKRVARRGERHLGAQPCHGEHHAEAEAGAQAELAVDRQVTRAPADATANRSRERDLPEARAQLAGALAAPNVASTVMLVVDDSKLCCLLLQELPSQRPPECEEQRPQPPLERVERPRFLRFGPIDRIRERLLDVATHMINTASHRGSSFKYLNSQLDICRERAPKFNLHLASDRFCFVLCRQIGNCTQGKSRPTGYVVREYPEGEAISRDQGQQAGVRDGARFAQLVSSARLDGIEAEGCKGCQFPTVDGAPRWKHTSSVASGVWQRLGQAGWRRTLSLAAPFAGTLLVGVLFSADLTADGVARVEFTFLGPSAVRLRLAQ